MNLPKKINESSERYIKARFHLVLKQTVYRLVILFFLGIFDIERKMSGMIDAEKGNFNIFITYYTFYYNYYMKLSAKIKLSKMVTP